MEGNETMMSGGSLQISTDVIAKIAGIAAKEIEGVQQISCGGQGVKSILGKASMQKPIQVKMEEGIAEITISLLAAYGTRVNVMGEKVQQNVKNAVQNMTGITVSRVNVVIAGLAENQAEDNN